MLDIFESVGVVIYLYYVVFVDSVDSAVGALSDLFAAFDRDDFVCLFNLHHLGETGHIKNLVHL